MQRVQDGDYNWVATQLESKVIVPSRLEPRERMATTETSLPARSTPQQTSDALNVIAEAAFEIPADAHTYEGFVRWATSAEFPEQGRIDFLGGRLFIDMASEEINSHGKLKQAIQSTLDRFCREEELGEMLPDGVLFASSDADSGCEPDAMLCTFEGLTSGRIRYVERDPGSGRQMSVQGSPDIVVEIVSNSSVRKDTRDLRERYFLAGVREYWIVDARGMTMTFHVLVRGNDEWIESLPDGDGFRRSTVLNRRVRIDRGASRIGTVRYDVLITE